MSGAPTRSTTARSTVWAWTTAFRRVARSRGLRVVGERSWDQKQARYPRLVDQVRRSGADGVFLGGLLFPNGGQLIKDLRAGLGDDVRLLAPDGFGPPSAVVQRAGAAAERMTISKPDIPRRLLSPDGRRFHDAISARLGRTPCCHTMYGAQAAEVLLDAIAASDGTRASVTTQLFRRRVRNGLLGSFGFDRNGDTTLRRILIHRIHRGELTFVTAITPREAHRALIYRSLPRRAACIYRRPGRSSSQAAIGRQRRPEESVMRHTTTRISRHVGVALAIGAVAAPAAVAQSPDAIDLNAAAAELKQVDARSPDAKDFAAGRNPGDQPVPKVVTVPRLVEVPTSGGMQWDDVAIGAGGAIGPRARGHGRRGHGHPAAPPARGRPRQARVAREPDGGGGAYARRPRRASGQAGAQPAAEAAEGRAAAAARGQGGADAKHLDRCGRRHERVGDRAAVAQRHGGDDVAVDLGHQALPVSGRALSSAARDNSGPGVGETSGADGEGRFGVALRRGVCERDGSGSWARACQSDARLGPCGRPASVRRACAHAGVRAPEPAWAPSLCASRARPPRRPWGWSIVRA